MLKESSVAVYLFVALAKRDYKVGLMEMELKKTEKEKRVNAQFIQT